VNRNEPAVRLVRRLLRTAYRDLVLAYAAAPEIDLALVDVTVAAGSSTQVAPIVYSSEEVTATDAALGETGTVKVTYSADGVAPVSRTAAVTVAEGVDLAAGPATEVTAKPGKSFDAALQVQNNTDKAVHGTAVIFGTDYAFSSIKQFGNCFYGGGQVNACTFDQDLEPGATYEVVLPYQLRKR
jgi:hypothetical protein